MAVEVRTPLRAILACCQQCCAGITKGIDGPSGCNSPDCAVYPYRSGKRNPDAPQTPIKSIRKRCLQCAATAHEVRHCTDQEDCHFWPYRLGRRPQPDCAVRDTNSEGLNPPASRGLGAPDRVAQDKGGKT